MVEPVIIVLDGNKSLVLLSRSYLFANVNKIKKNIHAIRKAVNDRQLPNLTNIFMRMLTQDPRKSSKKIKSFSSTIYNQIGEKIYITK